ncbi:MAG: S49 family peptidase [Alphaproteobacteria bacterium]|nr:S49 family peptidase [Alphaproteobacteria bacterium]
MENRSLTEDIDKIARGRVWTGAEAIKLGLVDALGGFDEALEAAKQQGKIADNQKIKIVNYPQPKSLSEKISDLLFNDIVAMPRLFEQSGVDIRYLKLFKRMQYDTILSPFELKM